MKTLSAHTTTPTTKLLFCRCLNDSGSMSFFIVSCIVRTLFCNDEMAWWEDKQESEYKWMAWHTQYKVLFVAKKGEKHKKRYIINFLI